MFQTRTVLFLSIAVTSFLPWNSISAQTLQACKQATSKTVQSCLDKIGETQTSIDFNHNSEAKTLVANRQDRVNGAQGALAAATAGDAQKWEDARNECLRKVNPKQNQCEPKECKISEVDNPGMSNGDKAMQIRVDQNHAKELTSSCEDMINKQVEFADTKKADNSAIAQRAVAQSRDTSSDNQVCEEGQACGKPHEDVQQVADYVQCMQIGQSLVTGRASYFAMLKQANPGVKMYSQGAGPCN